MSDRRAVAELVGAIMLFGILIISLSLYQAQVVPAQNERVEYQHSQQVQNQLTDVRNAILGTAWSGNSRPTSVTLGTRYPGRTVAVNPPPATGRLATEELGNVTLTNVTAASGPGGLREYLESKDHTLSYGTSALVYTPDYNEYHDAPRTVYENTLLYNAFASGDERSLPLTGDSLVSASGDRVSLVVLTGDYRENGVGSATVDPQSVSTPSGGVYVNGSLNVSMPTRFPVNGTQAWPQLFPATARNVHGTDGGENLTFSMERGANLQIGAANVGSGGAEAHPAYVTRVSPRARKVSQSDASAFTRTGPRPVPEPVRRSDRERDGSRHSTQRGDRIGRHRDVRVRGKRERDRERLVRLKRDRWPAGAVDELQRDGWHRRVRWHARGGQYANVRRRRGPV
ncbi:SNUT3/LISCH7 family protein [Halarchaeum acidiphilum]|uniref:SNUT3/LISCH7 family protein n=1 Tax=Halarchaeum acidiphilum TaxID=489138 RepID=UPI000677AF2F|nr:SNUT3/LISCH7 family protein [Halarchaeum acidiphilum]